jgi:hypothetical protein
VIADENNIDAAAAARAFFGRYYGGCGRPVRILHTAAVRFEHAESATGATVPCPDSIVWMAGNSRNDGDGLRETLVAGARQGWARKQLAASRRGWSAVCQQQMAAYFAETAQLAGWRLARLLVQDQCPVNALTTRAVDSSMVEDAHTATTTAVGISYNQIKAVCHSYAAAKQLFKSRLLTWPDNAAKRALTAHIFTEAVLSSPLNLDPL